MIYLKVLGIYMLAVLAITGYFLPRLRARAITGRAFWEKIEHAIVWVSIPVAAYLIYKFAS